MRNNEPATVLSLIGCMVQVGPEIRITAVADGVLLYGLLIRERGSDVEITYLSAKWTVGVENTVVVCRLVDGVFVYAMIRMS